MLLYIAMYVHTSTIYASYDDRNDHMSLYYSESGWSLLLPAVIDFIFAMTYSPLVEVIDVFLTRSTTVSNNMVKSSYIQLLTIWFITKIGIAIYFIASGIAIYGHAITLWIS